MSSGSQTARPDVWWEQQPARTRTAASSRVIQKEYDRKRVTSANPFRIVDEAHSSGLKTRSDLMDQRRDSSRNAFSGYDSDGNVDNNEIVSCQSPKGPSMNRSQRMNEELLERRKRIPGWLALTSIPPLLLTNNRPLSLSRI